MPPQWFCFGIRPVVSAAEEPLLNIFNCILHSPDHYIHFTTQCRKRADFALCLLQMKPLHRWCSPLEINWTWDQMHPILGLKTTIWATQFCCLTLNYSDMLDMPAERSAQWDLILPSFQILKYGNKYRKDLHQSSLAKRCPLVKSITVMNASIRPRRTSSFLILRAPQ